MFTAGAATIVARTASDIPAGALPLVRPQLLQRLGGSVAELFPEFQESFSSTVDAMKAHWTPPVLAATNMGRGWLIDLLMEGEHGNLFLNNSFPPYAPSLRDQLGPEAIPRAWLALYESMESFTITDRSSYSPICWRNTLLPRPLTLQDYKKFVDVDLPSKDVVARFGAAEADNLRCWLLTDCDESLWTVERRDGRRLYHVKGTDLANVQVFSNPQQMSDRYLAHVVSSGAPSDFDFRSN